MAKIRLDDNFDLEKFDPYKDTLVTTVRGTAEEVKEVLDKLMGDETNKIKRNTVSLRQKWISVKERMPPLKEKVLVWAVGKSKLTMGKTYCDVTFTAEVMGEVRWWEFWLWFLEDWDITHWMPLPDAPEVEDE